MSMKAPAPVVADPFTVTTALPKQRSPRKWPSSQVTLLNRAIGANLMAARTAAGLSQEEAAVLLECTQSSISRWESGHRLITVNNLYAAAHCYDVPVASLLP